MQIPTGNTKADIKAREATIAAHYKKWCDENPSKRAYNYDLKDYISVEYLSMDETRRHAAKSYLSTLAVLQLDVILKTARKVGKTLPVKEKSKNQKPFSKMIRMECEFAGLGTVKMMVGVKKKTAGKVQYCITALRK